MKIDEMKLFSILRTRGITQRKLASDTGMSRVTISNICRGCSCRWETAQKVADCLGVQIDEILPAAPLGRPRA